MIAGAHKAGTSTLLRYLGAHPGATAQIRPEMTYFTDAQLSQRDLSVYFDQYFGAPKGHDTVHIAKLAGLMYEREGLERLYKHNPDVQVAVIVREPVARAYSAYWYSYMKGREPLDSFEAALEADDARFGTDRNSARICEYLDRSLYAKHVELLYELFGREHVHVFILEEFKQAPDETVAPLLRSAGLDPSAIPPLARTTNAARRPRSVQLARLRRSQAAGARLLKRVLPLRTRDALRARWLRFNEVPWSPPPIAEVTQAELRAYFAEPNRRLGQLLDRDLSGVWPGLPA
jgi:hypothetical protein